MAEKTMRQMSPKYVTKEEWYLGKFQLFLEFA